MDDLQKASIMRARSAINMALSEAPTRSGEFVKAARGLLTKAAVGATTTGDVEGTNLQALAQSFIASIANRNLLDAVARYATLVPDDSFKVMIASGTVSGSADEAMPKAIRRLGLAVEDMDKRKVIALTVLTREMLTAAGEQIFRRELENSLIAASNAALLDALTIDTVPSTGTVLGDLRAGLEAAADSDGYVIAAPRSVVRSLALDADGRMSATTGGFYVPDVLVIPAAVDSLTVIPASRVALKLREPFVKDASHASVMMSDTPEMPGELVSLWQTNSRALAIERRFDIHSDAPAIQVVSA